ALGIEHPFHARTVVRGGEDRAELLDDRGLSARIELFRAPERRHDSACCFVLAERDMRTGKKDYALGSLRRGVAEGPDDRGRIRILAVKRRFALAAQPSLSRPLGQHSR